MTVDETDNNRVPLDAMAVNTLESKRHIRRGDKLMQTGDRLKETGLAPCVGDTHSPFVSGFRLSSPSLLL